MQKKTITEKNFFSEKICVTNKYIYLFELYNNSKKICLLKFHGKLDNQVFQVSEAPNLLHFLN